MSRDDDLLAECVANPDDDHARTVWADHVGGERGELVAVQCADRAALSAGELAVLNRRERELLANAMAWSGLAGIAHRVRFRRGFVDAIDCNAIAYVEHAEHIAAVAPLVTGLTIRELAPRSQQTRTDTEAEARLRDVIAALGFERIRALDLVDRYTEQQIVAALVDTGALRQLRALGLPVSPPAIAQLLRAGLGHIDRLWLHGALTFDVFRAIATSAVRLTALDVEGTSPADVACFPNVVDLTLRYPRDAQIELGELAPRLRRLVVRTIPRYPVIELAGLRACERLEALALDDGVRLRDLALPSLRELQLGYTELDVRSIAPQLDLLDLRRAARLANPPSCAGDVLVDEPVDYELLHAGPVARGEWRVHPLRQSGVRGAPAWLVLETGLETGRVWEIGELGLLRIGRGNLQTIAILHESVARAHAELEWLDHAWQLRDLVSTNGTHVDGVWIEERTPLADNACLDVGAVRLRFFTGPGGGARASERVEYLRRFDARTGLRRTPAHDVGAIITITSAWSIEYLKAAVAQRLLDAAAPGVAITWVDAFGGPTNGGFGVTPGESATELATACSAPVVLDTGTAAIALAVVSSPAPAAR